MKPIQLDRASCTGCHACVSKCPRECISMQRDDLGFLYPVIDSDRCISCGICMKVCEEVKQVPRTSERKIYAAKHKSLEIRKKSASGGVFTALANAILQDGGVVVGARYFEDMRVGHDFARNEAELSLLRGSKYTYSLCGKDVFEKTKEYLESGVTVLFSGTPCQVSAFKNYLGSDYENLLTVDILCHGIAAPKLYEDFVSRLSERNGAVGYIDFRYSADGNWHDPHTQVVYQNGKKGSGELENSYFRMFVRNYCLRESCYACGFARFDRVSDLTLGDFWGIEGTHAEFDSPHGVSVVVASTEKGRRLLQSASSEMELLECTERDCTHDQLNGLKPGGRNLNFVSDYRTYGFDFVHKKYTLTPLSIRMREKLYRIKLIKKLRDLIK